MADSFLKSRQTRYTAYAGTYILVILAVLGAINFLANRYDKSYDSTEERYQADLLRRSYALSAGARSAGPLHGAVSEAESGIHRSDEEAATGKIGRLPARRHHPGG